jgi:hypothetical protein
VADETKCRCRHCKRELEPTHSGPCPYCGQSGIECDKFCKDGVAVGDNPEGVQVTHLSPQGWKILFFLTGLAVTLANMLISGLISQWHRYPVMLAATMAIVLLMFKLRRSFRFIALCHHLTSSAFGRRTFK